MTGRPTKLTPELQAEICEYIAKGLPYSDACRLTGISESTFYRWKQRGQTEEEGEFREFWEEVTRADASFKEVHVGVIARSSLEPTIETRTVTNPDGTVSEHTTVKPPTTAGSMWLLERRHPNEFGRKTRLEHAGRIEGAQPHKVEITLHRPEGETEEDGDV